MTFTDKTWRYSTPSIEMTVEQMIADDTAAAVDLAMSDNAAGSPSRGVVCCSASRLRQPQLAAA